ncbi:MAG: hypothetical protein ACLGIA_06355 [Actinomycetes bacterium]
MAAFIIVIIVIIVLVGVGWLIFSGVVARGSAKASHGAPPGSREDRRDLLLGASLDPGGHDAWAPPQVQGDFPLHAVEPGSDQAKCGAPVRRVLDKRWPPSQEAACRACEEALSAQTTGNRSRR